MLELKQYLEPKSSLFLFGIRCSVSQESSSLKPEMDPTLLPTIIKKGSSMLDESKQNRKILSWGEVFKQIHVIGAIIGILVGFIVCFLPIDENDKIAKTFGILIIIATCWVTEILPLSISSLFPVVLFPLFGVLSATDISKEYFNDTIFMFLAGFLLSLAMERWNLHIRIALFITSFFERPRSILFGVMFASYLLSMWISNTAAALMMVTNVTALVETLEDHYGKKKMAKFSKAIMIGIAFACNIGGFATLIGTPPNMVFIRIYNQFFGDKEGAVEVSFSNWMIAVLPINFLFFLALWGFFAIKDCPSEKELKIDPGYCKNEYKKLGKSSYEETVVFIAFIVLALLWLTRSDMEFSETAKFYGWSNLFGSYKSYITDGTVGMFVVLLLFIIPTKKCLKRENSEEDDACILTWNTAKKLPWDLVLLFGGGFALAAACQASGLSAWIGEKLSLLKNLPVFLSVLIITIVICILTSFTSNTATANIIIPITVGIAQSTEIHPLIMMVPVTIASSCAFLLPVGTPPNLVVFASKRLTMGDMVKAGIVTTIMAVICIMIITFVMLPLVFGFNYNDFPEWAK